MAKVVVSLAHVGQPGAISECGRIVESAYSARISYALAEFLRDSGVEVVILASDLATKADKVDAAAAACAVEVHLNALRKQDVDDVDGDGDHLEYIADDRGRGFMVLYAAQDPKELALASRVTAALAEALPTRKNWGPQPVPGPMVARKKLTFLQDTKTTAVMVEALFLTNSAEVTWLLQPTAPAVLAMAIGNGILDWLDTQNARST